jgi:chromosome segregation ATPase
LKLARVEQERIALEVRLEQEQEYITNKLQKQIADAAKEKSLLEIRIKEERDKVVSMEEEKKKLQEQLRKLRLSVEVEEENISNKVLRSILHIVSVSS